LGAALHAQGVRVVREAGMYDLTIARSLGHGLGPTFDGVQPTNGLSPLWTLLMAPLLGWAPTAAAGLSAAVAVQTALFAASVLLVFLAARRLAGREGAAVAAVAWLAIGYRDALAGTDFALHAALVAALLLALARRAADVPSTRGAMAVGALAAVCVMVRVEDLVLAVVVALALAAAAPRGLAVRVLLAAALPALVTALLLAAASQAVCGTVVPVGAAVQWDWSRHELMRDGDYQSAGFWAAKVRHLLWPLRHAAERYGFSLVAGIAGTAVLVWHERRTAAAPRVLARTLAPPAAYAALQLLAYGLLYHGEFSFISGTFRYVVPPVLTALMLGVAVDRALAARSPAPVWRLAAVLACALAVLLTAASAWRWRERERHGLSMRPDYDAARWVEAHLPPEAVLATWRTGAVGYLSGRRVVDLSGLVNSWSYFRSERFDLCSYWERQHVSHLVDLFEDGRPSVDAPVTGAYGRCAHRLEPLWSSGSYGRPWRLQVYRLRPLS
jgi:hypothetical protein